MRLAPWHSPTQPAARQLNIMDASSVPQDTTAAELSPVAAVDAPVEAPPAMTPPPVAAKPRGHAAGVIGAALGGILTLGVTVGVRLLLTARKRKSKACSKAQQASAASTPKHASTAAGSQFISFGSPTPIPDFGSPRMIGKTLQAVSPAACVSGLMGLHRRAQCCGLADILLPAAAAAAARGAQASAATCSHTGARA